MGFFQTMRKLEQHINESKYGSYPEDMTPEDYASWDEALDNRQHKPQTREQVNKALRRINPIKMRQIDGDIKWVKRQVKKMGMNPEDWRLFL